MRACGDERMTLTRGEEVKVESIRKIALKMHNGIVRRLGNTRYMIKRNLISLRKFEKRGCAIKTYGDKILREAKGNMTVLED